MGAFTGAVCVCVCVNCSSLEDCSESFRLGREGRRSQRTGVFIFSSYPKFSYLNSCSVAASEELFSFPSDVALWFDIVPWPLLPLSIHLIFLGQIFAFDIEILLDHCVLFLGLVKVHWLSFLKQLECLTASNLTKLLQCCCHINGVCSVVFVLLPAVVSCHPVDILQYVMDKYRLCIEAEKGRAIS